MQLADARRYVAEMNDAGVPLHKIERFVSLMEISEQARLGLLRQARMASSQAGSAPGSGVEGNETRTFRLAHQGSDLRSGRIS